MILARSFFEAPRARSDRNMRSSETVESPASIFATRDWLEPRSFASRTCEIFFRTLILRTLSLSARRTSTKAASSGVRPRNSSAPPTLQPLAWRRSSFLLSISQSPYLELPVVVGKSPSAGIHNRFRHVSTLLGEDFQHNNRVFVDTVDYSPGCAPINDTKLMAPGPNGRHGPRMRQTQSLPTLQPSQQHTGFDPRLGGEGRAWYLT